MYRQWNTYVLFGGGGESPGLVTYDIESHRTERVLSLPPEQSVYAVDTSPDGGRMAVGTKAGYLYLPADSPPTDERSTNKMRVFLQGPPILSVHFVDDLHLAATDTTGRCLVWDLQESTRPIALPVPGGEIIYGLFRLDDQYLAGLSSAGRVIVWAWARGVVAQKIKTPPAASVLALVRPVFWSSINCWVWPSSGGVLALFEWPGGRCQHVKAHEGDFYGVAVTGPDLLTVGKADHCLKRWSPSTEKLAETLTVLHGAVAMAAWQNDEPELALVDETGRAGVYLRKGDTIERARWLPESTYRLAMSPDPVALLSHARHRAESKARSLAVDIREQYTKGRLKDVDCLHGELRRIGYAHVSLVLQAEEARRQDDIAGELRAYAGLLPLVPDNYVYLTDSLARYAYLLERTWQIREACVVWQRLQAIGSREAESTQVLARLEKCREAMESHEHIIECADPLSTLIGSATALDKPLIGRYVLRAAGPPVRCHGAVSSTDVLERYEQVRRTVYKDALPIAERRQFVWLSGTAVERVEAVVAILDSSLQVARPQYCLKIWRTESYTVFTPTIIIWASDQAPGMTAIEHNHQVSSLLRYVEESHSYRAVALAIHECFKEVMARLLTRQLAVKSYERGDEYA